MGLEVSMARTAVTLSLDEIVWRRTRTYAFLKGITASSIVEEFLRELVMEEETASAADDQSGSEALDAGEDRGVPSEHVGDEDRRGGGVRVP
jgi:hypothetical protein